MADTPAIRARGIFDTERYLHLFSPGSREAVRARMDPSTLALIDASPPSGWIPFERAREQGRAIVEEFGAARTLEFFSGSVGYFKDNTPLVRGLVASSRKLFGDTPYATLWLGSKAMAAMYRNLLTPEIASHDEHGAVFTLSNVYHPALLDEAAVLFFKGYAEGMAQLVRQI